MNYFECCMKCIPPKRYPGCSGKCPEYKTAKDRYEADKAKNNEKYALKYYINEHNAAVKDGIAKYAARRKRRDR